MKTKKESGNLIRLIVMYTNLEYRARERQRKREIGGRLAKLDEKKGDGDIEREIENKGGNFLLEEEHEDFVVAVIK